MQLAPRPVPAALRAEDWTGKLITVEELGAYQGSGESLLVGAKDVNQAMIAEAMVAGGGLHSSVLLVYPHPEGKSRLPFWADGAVAMRTAVTKEFVHGSLALPRLKGKQSAPQTVKAEETEVLRIIISKELAGDKAWKEAMKGFRAYVMAHLPVTDAWGAARSALRSPGRARTGSSLSRRGVSRATASIGSTLRRGSRWRPTTSGSRRSSASGAW